eukprot:359362-Chlamydomonas_euryale.AAC.1
MSPFTPHAPPSAPLSQPSAAACRLPRRATTPLHGLPAAVVRTRNGPRSRPGASATHERSRRHQCPHAASAGTVARSARGAQACQGGLQHVGRGRGRRLSRYCGAQREGASAWRLHIPARYPRLFRRQP